MDENDPYSKIDDTQMTEHEADRKRREFEKFEKIKNTKKSSWSPFGSLGDSLAPSNETIARVINIAGTSAAEQVVRTVGVPFKVRILDISHNTETNKIYVRFHREIDINNYDASQPPPGTFRACHKILAYMRFPRAMITIERVLLDIFVAEDFFTDAKGNIHPVVTCEANISDVDRENLIKFIKGIERTQELLDDHEARIQPGFEATLRKVLDSQSDTSQGVVIIDPYKKIDINLKRSDSITKSDDTEKNKELALSQASNIIDYFILTDMQQRPFVSILTQKEGYREISAGPLSFQQGMFVIKSAPFQRQTNVEPTGGAFELQERVMEENNFRKKIGAIKYETPKYLILLSHRGFGLSPVVSNAIRKVIEEGLKGPLIKASDNLKMSMGDVNGPYRKIIRDVRNLIWYVFLLILALNVFSGVATEAINNFFGVKTKPQPLLLKQRSRKKTVKRLKQATRSRRRR